MTSTAPITVIVPVYGGLDDVTRCLDSVIRHAPSIRRPFEVLVIDDGSPDPAIPAFLEEFGSRPAPVPVTILHNDENLGFVRTVNRGLELAAGDVVMLNSDTVVTDAWLDRLAEAAELPDVATVTPVTSHGSICTLTQPLLDAFVLEGPDPDIDACAAFVAANSLQLRPEVITGVGFCMYTTRAALDLCGFLDVTFGPGYGEEVDFCLRATRLGLRHLVDDSTFVYHRGGVSFGDGQREGLARGSAILDGRYPFFRPANTRERAEEPLAVSFAALELSLVERGADRPHVLHILHSPPGETGGTEKWIRSLMESLHDDFDFSVLYPVRSGFALRAFWNAPDGAPIEREFLMPGGATQVTQPNDELAGAALAMALDLFDFDVVHVQNLIGHSLAPLEVLSEFPGTVVVSVHDMFLACPNFSLLYKKSSACGIPDDRSTCDACLATIAIEPMPGSPFITNLSMDYLDEFRATVEHHLGAVDRWVFPTRSAADYFLRVYDPGDDRIEVIEHGAIVSLERPGAFPTAHATAEPLRVAFVGIGWSKKGLDVVNELADRLAETSIEIHHFGNLKQAASANLVVHGPYDNEYLPELLQLAGIHVVLLPGAYAETFGLVMTEALVAGIPIIGARYGALGERIRATGAGWVIDPADPGGILALIQHLDRARDELARVTNKARDVSLKTVRETAWRYEELYRMNAKEPA